MEHTKYKKAKKAIDNTRSYLAQSLKERVQPSVIVIEYPDGSTEIVKGLL